MFDQVTISGRRGWFCETVYIMLCIAVNRINVIFVCVCACVCVSTVFTYFLFCVSVWVLLPLDGEIKMYI